MVGFLLHSNKHQLQVLRQLYRS